MIQHFQQPIKSFKTKTSAPSKFNSISKTEKIEVEMRRSTLKHEELARRKEAEPKVSERRF